MEFFKLIPDTFWSAMLGAVLPLAGVVISNRNNSKNLVKQIQHEAEMRSQERTLALRRDVYLKMAQETVKANHFLTSLPHLDPTKLDLASGISGFQEVASQLQLISEPTTQGHVNKLVALYTSLTLESFRQALPLQLIRNNIRLWEQYFERSSIQINRILAERRTMIESVKYDQQRWDALQSSLDFYNEQAKSQHLKSQELWADFNAKNIIYSKALLNNLQKSTTVQLELLVELRKDIGLASEVDILNEQIEQFQRGMNSQLDDLIIAFNKIKEMNVQDNSDDH